ncbi:MAG: hypothetical protein M3352_04610, partial [Bacteroidota bacterium]|nr:hypothetical protein [Bacteroidota bacterium]
AGVGVGYFDGPSAPFLNKNQNEIVTPSEPSLYNGLYEEWKTLLQAQLKKQEDFSPIINHAEQFQNIK